MDRSERRDLVRWAVVGLMLLAMIGAYTWAFRCRIFPFQMRADIARLEKRIEELEQHGQKP